MSAIDKYRKAAMYIHCLTENDKQWMLARLGESEVKLIRKHLLELNNLSVPRDLKFVKAAIEELDEKSEKELYEILNRSVLSDIQSVLDVFEREPAWVGACLTQEYPGLVDSYITPRLSKITLREIEKYTTNDECKFAPKLKIALFDVVAGQLRKGSSESASNKDVLSFETAMQKAV